MIKSFADAESETIGNQQRSRQLPGDIQQRALNKLAMLYHARDLMALGIPPANRLETRSGNRAGQHNIRINQQWRICFRWKTGDAFDVEIADYHWKEPTMSKLHFPHPGEILRTEFLDEMSDPLGHIMDVISGG